MGAVASEWPIAPFLALALAAVKEQAMVAWTDLAEVSVVNLNGSDPTKDLKAVPRLVVFKRPTPTAKDPATEPPAELWGTYCITNNDFIPLMDRDYFNREDAKREVARFALRSLDRAWYAALRSLSPPP